MGRTILTLSKPFSQRLILAMKNSLLRLIHPKAIAGHHNVMVMKQKQHIVRGLKIREKR